VSMVERTTGAISVDLSIPVQADLVVLARLAAATLASRVGFGVEDIEDLRLAVEELCLSLVGSGDDGRLHLNYECDDDAITVTCEYEAGEAPTGSRRDAADDLSLRILDALVDDHGHDFCDRRPSAWLSKRRSDAPA
jgi:serine/threonine-protein kinase RsbW